ncbi:MAG: 3-phosphoshikimate 1-carboxyvinyltransferase, partial [Bacillota bacterium]
MTLTINPVNQLKGECRVPGDKSISHRALILSSLARGKSKIQGLLEGEDCLHTLQAMQRLGVQIDRHSPGDFTVRGQGLQGLQEPEDILECGNSGTCFRLLSGLLAGNNFYSVLTGDDSLRGRPMDRIIKPLTEMGARIWARQQKYAPLSFRGHHLQGIEYDLPVASAQVKSCLLLAGLYTEEKVVLTEPGPSRDHTERMLKKSGIELEIEGRT